MDDARRETVAEKAFMKDWSEKREQSEMDSARAAVPCTLARLGWEHRLPGATWEDYQARCDEYSQWLMARNKATAEDWKKEHPGWYR
jgi:hypothetical protein